MTPESLPNHDYWKIDPKRAKVTRELNRDTLAASLSDVYGVEAESDGEDVQVCARWQVDPKHCDESLLDEMTPLLKEIMRTPEVRERLASLIQEAGGIEGPSGILQVVTGLGQPVSITEE